MKKNFYLIALCMSWVFVLQSQAVNVVPTAGVYYNIVQTPSNMVIGSVSTQPVVQTSANTFDQAFQFIPVQGKANTYYIQNYFGMYMNKSTSDNWDMIYQSTTNLLNSEWVITDDASSTTVFRLMLNVNSKYLATDAVTNNSYLYCDKAVDHVRGLFTLVPATIPTDLVDAYNGLAIGVANINAVTSNITLPTVSGTKGITVRWASSRPTVIDTLGNVTRPAIYDTKVTLSATLSQVLGTKTYSMTKVFVATVLGVAGTPDAIAEWNFATENITLVNDTFRVKDIQSNFVGKLVNDARIRTIGSTTKFNVLDLGNGTGYFDMGKEIGKAIYSLNDYTMMGYFRVDPAYTGINSNGNFYWTFSNTPDVMTDKNGYIIGSLKAESQSVSTSYYSTGNQATGANVNAGIGAWHHFAYVQSGSTGTVYVDGSIVATNTSMTNLPSSIALAGREGTLYNWLGRSNYVTDVYLRNTLLYDFQVLSFALTPDDFTFGIENLVTPVTSTLDALTSAFTENPDYTVPELTAEMNNLSLGDLSAVTSNITLPKVGTLDPTISILWKTTNDKLIDATGVVTRPNYYNYNDTLTATLSKNGQSVLKKFPATVVMKDGTQFTNNLLVKYDFSTVSDSTVTDVAEKHFTGTLKKNATVHSIGSTVKYNVLSLGDSIGYFDMGPEIGKLMYNLTDYTMCAYFRIDASYTKLAKAGNFLWNFSNSKDIINNPTGYLIASLKNQAATISPTNWSLEQTVAVADSALKDGWHHFAYVQSGTTGSVYIDGASSWTGAVTSLPSTTLAKAGQLGTLYNWIGRSCYVSDVYLQKTMVYDFRLYKTPLNDEQIQTTVLNVGNTINSLNVAYAEAPTAVNSVKDYTSYKIVTSVGQINVLGLTGTEKIALYDIAGRQIKLTKASTISVNSGVYIVKIDNYVTKVVVK